MVNFVICRGGAGRALLAVVLSATIALPAVAEPRSTADAVYTKAQAKKGEKLFKQNCLVCHDKKYFRPVLQAWNGQSVGIFYDMMAGSMPESNPGGMLDSEYVDILAYIFSLSKYPVGEEKLDYRGGKLSEITISDP